MAAAAVGRVRTVHRVVATAMHSAAGRALHPRRWRPRAAHASLGAGSALPDQTAALKRRAEERDARPAAHGARVVNVDLAFPWITHSHNYSSMIAAAMRIEQLVIERYLRITSAELEDMELWTLDHCAAVVAEWQGRAAPTVVYEFDPITADVVTAIEAALPAMRAEMAAIESDADVAAGIAKWRQGSCEVECGEPGYCADERKLNDMAASVCMTPGALRITTAMLRAYAAQLSARDSVTTDTTSAPTGPTHHLTAPAPLVAQAQSLA